MTAHANAAIDRRAWPVTRKRAGSGGAYNNNGEWVPAADVTTSIKAVVQPLTGNKLMDVPEGVRVEEMWVIWSRSEVAMEDRIVTNGETYRVMHAWPRTSDGDFYRAALGKVTT